MRCVSLCTAENYKLPQIATFLKSQGYIIRPYRKLLYIKHHYNPGDIFVFAHGCVVLWGLKRKDELKLLEQIKPYSINPLANIEHDRFVYRYGNSTEMTTHETLNADIIVLESDNIQIKLAISYGLAQSIQLEAYESAIQKTIDENAHFPKQLAQHGTIPLSQKEISRHLGKIFLARSYINLNSDYLEDPEFFWEHPSNEEHYTMSKKFLYIPRRVFALNQKLNILHELFEILNSQRQHRHSNILEMTIILLIFIEILITLFFKSVI